MFNAKQSRIFFAEKRNNVRNNREIEQLVKKLRKLLSEGANPFCAVRAPDAEPKVREVIGKAFPPAIFTALLCGEIEIAKMFLDECKIPAETRAKLINNIWDLRGDHQACSLLAAAIAGPFVCLSQKAKPSRYCRKALEAVKFALSIGCDPNGPTGIFTFGWPEPGTVDDANSTKMSALCIGEEYMDATRRGAQHKLSVTGAGAKMSRYMRPLHVLTLTTGGDYWEPELALECGKLLVNAGADINSTWGSGDTVLTISISIHQTLAQNLEAQGEKHKEVESFDILESVHLALKLGADPNLPSAQPQYMFRPLDQIVAAGVPDALSVDLARLILEYGADFTPIPLTLLMQGQVVEYDYLRVCVECGDTDLIRFALTEGGVDPNVRLTGGGFPTLLMLAIREGDVEMVRTILELGGDPFAKNGGNPSSSALETARDAVQMAREAGFPYDKEITEFDKVKRRYGARIPPTIKGLVEIRELVERKAREMREKGEK